MLKIRKKHWVGIPVLLCFLWLLDWAGGLRAMALQEAAKRGDTRLAKLLIGLGSDVNGKD